ncbi:MAG TPA: glycoside hydrolase family 75 protein [Polyangia bacterium]
MALFVSRVSPAVMLALAVGCHGGGPGRGDGAAADGAVDSGAADGDGGAADLAGVGAAPDLSLADLGIAGDVVDKLLMLTANCTTANMVSAHTYPDPGSLVNDVPICALNGAIFFDSDMDIDCDGRPTGNLCPGPDPSYQPDTAFHNLQDQPLEAAVTPYVVIPADFAYPGLDTSNGGNVVAVIYNHQLAFAVFGDTGPTDLIGEASYACAATLGIDPNPATGGVRSGVTYVVFVGANTAPHDIESQAETRQLGEQLLTQLLANN